MIRYNSVSYNVNEGLLQSTIADVEFDKYNFCWISYPNGIQRFDGTTFKLIPIQGGLPDNKFCRFFKTSTNELIISHSKGISRYDAESNRFIQTYTYPTENIQPAQIIGEDEGFIYFLTKDMDIYSLTLSNFSIVQTTQTGLNKLAKKMRLL
jgi:ligand-binding sensor domain-containing protein